MVVERRRGVGAYAPGTSSRIKIREGGFTHEENWHVDQRRGLSGPECGYEGGCEDAVQQRGAAGDLRFSGRI